MTYKPPKRRRRSIRLAGYDYAQPGAYFVTLCAQGRACLFGDVVDGNMVLNEYGRVVYGRIRSLPRHFSRLRVDAFVVMPNHVHVLLVITCDGVEGNRTAGSHHGDRHGGVGGSGDGDRHRRGEASVIPGATEMTGIRLAGGDRVADGTDASPLQTLSGETLSDRLNRKQPTGTNAGSLGAVIQNLKSTATRAINRRRRTPGAPVWQRGFYERIVRNQKVMDRIRRYIADNPARWHADRHHPDRPR